MPKLTPLQVRNLLVAALAAGGVVWNVLRGGPLWLTAIFALCSLLAVGSAVLNRTPS
ncbi:hypothetical protein ORV05_05950 [Amycolatopsis cynarae]|uniref:DUF2892 domain-containing protein n=1 Tax=Amycolatopsis cynarae TaxID=2995223 RepID=A0ABY7B9C6_9PSEU|nr:MULTISPECIES: hypothetical protein [Amycolatopsis]WAL67328.1 hypothetical protein ORV05_05950 [Amycolatopsis sp. HUAS 11-8]